MSWAWPPCRQGAPPLMTSVATWLSSLPHKGGCRASPYLPAIPSSSLSHSPCSACRQSTQMPCSVGRAPWPLAFLPLRASSSTSHPPTYLLALCHGSLALLRSHHCCTAAADHRRQDHRPNTRGQASMGHYGVRCGYPQGRTDLLDVPYHSIATGKHPDDRKRRFPETPLL